MKHNSLHRNREFMMGEGNQVASVNMFTLQRCLAPMLTQLVGCPAPMLTKPAVCVVKTDHFQLT